MVTALRIGSRSIGPGHSCFIIAEAGVNHNGDLELARRMIDVAWQAGADAVKFQTFRSESVISPLAPKAMYQQATTGNTESQLEMVKKLELSPEATRALFDYCGEKGILFLSTPFDVASADFLRGLGMQAIKIASGEITNHGFLAHLAGQGLPVMLSTGMADLEEVRSAVTVIREAGANQISLLQCTSNYPADPADANLRAMETMAREFGVPVGYSDHVSGNAVAFAAVALGASIIEKHFTLDRGLPGPDQSASLEPAELSELVRGARAVEVALGDGIKRPAASEANTTQVARRSLVAEHDLPAGWILASVDLAAKRPGTGIPPSRLNELLGRRLKRALNQNELLNLEDVE